uniref:Uncharacterized protein n=1 Tax=Timema shepardi TaxID=629360 RepID=A0A7R9B611_TIMSH|nr:unnamed protein product [Timema shepardi]
MNTPSETSSSLLESMAPENTHCGDGCVETRSNMYVTPKDRQHDWRHTLTRSEREFELRRAHKGINTGYTAGRLKTRKTSVHISVRSKIAHTALTGIGVTHSRTSSRQECGYKLEQEPLSLFLLEKQQTNNSNARNQSRQRSATSVFTIMKVARNTTHSSRSVTSITETEEAPFNDKEGRRIHSRRQFESRFGVRQIHSKPLSTSHPPTAHTSRPLKPPSVPKDKENSPPANSGKEWSSHHYLCDQDKRHMSTQFPSFCENISLQSKSVRHGSEIESSNRRDVCFQVPSEDRSDGTGQFRDQNVNVLRKRSVCIQVPSEHEVLSERGSGRRHQEQDRVSGAPTGVRSHAHPTEQCSTQVSSAPTGVRSHAHPTEQCITQVSGAPTGVRSHAHPTEQCSTQVSGARTHPTEQCSTQVSGAPTHPTEQCITQVSGAPTGVRSHAHPTEQCSTQVSGAPTHPTEQCSTQVSGAPTGVRSHAHPTEQCSTQVSGAPTGVRSHAHPTEQCSGSCKESSTQTRTVVITPRSSGHTGTLESILDISRDKDHHEPQPYDSGRDTPMCCCECRKVLKELLLENKKHVRRKKEQPIKHLPDNTGLKKCFNCGIRPVSDMGQNVEFTGNSSSSMASKPINKESRPAKAPRFTERKTVATETVATSAVQTSSSVRAMPVIRPHWFSPEDIDRRLSKRCPCCFALEEDLEPKTKISPCRCHLEDTSPVGTTTHQTVGCDLPVDPPTKTASKPPIGYILTVESSSSLLLSEEEDMMRRMSLEEVQIKIPSRRPFVHTKEVLGESSGVSSKKSMRETPSEKKRPKERKLTLQKLMAKKRVSSKVLWLVTFPFGTARAFNSTENSKGMSLKNTKTRNISKGGGESDASIFIVVVANLESFLQCRGTVNGYMVCWEAAPYIVVNLIRMGESRKNDKHENIEKGNYGGGRAGREN